MGVLIMLMMVILGCDDADDRDGFDIVDYDYDVN